MQHLANFSTSSQSNKYMQDTKYKKRHQNFIEFVRISHAICNNKKCKIVTFNRPIKKNTTLDNVVTFDTSNESLFAHRLSLNTELLAFLFFLEGCPKKLLLFLIICEVDDTTCLFSWNSQTVDMFKEFCKTLDTQSSYVEKQQKKCYLLRDWFGICKCIVRYVRCYRWRKCNVNI